MKVSQCPRVDKINKASQILKPNNRFSENSDVISIDTGIIRIRIKPGAKTGYTIMIAAEKITYHNREL